MTAPLTATLSDFLLARIAEDEAAARECVTWIENAPSLNDCATHHNPRRVLAECESKRRIVAELRDLSGEDDDDQAWALEYGDNAQRVAIATLRLLALPYADHPDYRQEWRA